MNHATNWLPGLLMVTLGLAAAGAALLFTRGRSTKAGSGREAQLADLEHRVAFLLEQLRALDTERRQLGEARYAEDHSRLEREAAEALRARDAFARELALQAQSVDPHPGPVTVQGEGGFFKRHPQFGGALWGGGVVLFFVALGFVLTSQQKDRGNGEMTGMRPPMGANAEPGEGAPGSGTPHDEDAVFASALERAKKNPADLDASAFAVHELIRRQDFEQAATLTNQALAADPFHVETRIHKAVLRATEGDFPGAMSDLETIARTWPEAWEALLFRGALAMQTGNSELALESFERFVVQAPADEQPPQLQSAIAMLRQKVGR